MSGIMRRLAGFLLAPLFTAMMASAQSGAEQPLPEVTTLIQQTISHQRLLEENERDYVFREHVTLNKLRKECTWAPQCPGDPSPGHSLAYEVLHYTGLEFEIFWLDGIRVAREMPTCQRCPNIEADDLTQTIPISDSELAAENQRLDNEIAAAKELRAQGKDPSSTDVPPQMRLSKMLELCRFSNPRRQVIEGRPTRLLDFTVKGRPTILLNFTCGSSAKPVSAVEGILRSFSGSIGIDEEDRAVQRVDGRFLADVRLDGGNIKIRKGTRVAIETVRLDSAIWALAAVTVWGEARYFDLVLDGNGYIFAGQYRRFDATSRILPGVSVVPSDPPKPPRSDASHP